MSRYLKNKILNGAGLQAILRRLKPQAVETSQASLSNSSSAQEYQGWAGLYKGRRVLGWVARPDVPNQKYSIRVRIGEYLSDPITANEPRDHLQERSIGDGAYGFRMTIPPQVTLSADSRIEIILAESLAAICLVSQTSISETLASERKRSRQRPVKSKNRKREQQNIVLIWCPISISGLTTQLVQVTEIFRANRIPYRISYHTEPTDKEHREIANWIEPADVDQPKLVLYFERFAEFDRGFDGALKVFYVNLDWLNDGIGPLVRTYADIVLAPVPYLLDQLKENFSNQSVLYMPWPSIFQPPENDATIAHRTDSTIRILYLGNDYDDISRKSPFAVIDAIESCTRTDLRFYLKFRTPLPADIRERLLSSPLVETLIDAPTDSETILRLHREVDVSLIPNECEGNGLTILEAWSLGVVPAVLDGHPMRDIVSDHNGFLIDCDDVGQREQTKLYKTDAARILSFLNSLTIPDVERRRDAVLSMADDLVERQANLQRFLLAVVRMSGIKFKLEKQLLRRAHFEEEGDGRPLIEEVMFSDQSHRAYTKPAELIDIVMTTSQRAEHFRRSFDRLLVAIDKSPYLHRLIIMVDGLDPDTDAVLKSHSARIDQVLWTGSRMGLPYMWNMLRDLVRNTIARTERRPDYVCYIQDDCLIENPESYFKIMVETAETAHPGYLGFVSGFHTAVHPGFAESVLDGNRIIFSDSVDGKNFLARPRTLFGIGPLTWWFSDGMRRGNPGPVRGSHFDLWQWKESPNSLTVQGRVNLILPDLTRHTAVEPESSTWDNDTTAESVRSRVEDGRIYIVNGG